MSLQPTRHSVSCNVKGVEPLTLTPSSSSSWPPHSQGTVEPRAWSSPGASGCLAGFVIQKGVRCSVDLQSKTICGSARRASTLGHIPFHPNCVYRFKICFWLQRSVSNRPLKAKQKLYLSTKASTFCFWVRFFPILLHSIAGEKQIVIARCRLKNDSLTVVFRDAIESSCHIFCLLCCYPTLIYSLHRFLGWNLIAGDFLLFIVATVVLRVEKGFRVMFSYSLNVE